MYELKAFYNPLREVGGDYFDVIELPATRMLFALADVSGKGIPAALLAANIQALVRSIASVESTPLALAKQINKHLSRYTPSDRFATAAFIVLSRESGELTCQGKRESSVALVENFHEGCWRPALPLQAQVSKTQWILKGPDRPLPAGFVECDRYVVHLESKLGNFAAGYHLGDAQLTPTELAALVGQ